jgi:putative membrane protein
MNISQNRFSTRTLLMAAAVSVLAGCTLWQQPAPPAGVASTPPQAAAPSSTAQTQPASALPATVRPRMSPAASAKMQNRTVLTQIHQTDMMEIALGKMAQEKASSGDVRAYADQLVKDHTNVDQMVIAQAPTSGIDLEKGATAHRALRDATAHEKLVEKKLSSAKGPEFDRLFLRQASSDNLKLIRKLQQDRDTARNDDVEVTIDKTIPILEEHKKQAQILMKKEQAQAPANHTTAKAS